MTTTILTRTKTRMRVKEVKLPVTQGVLGTGIDVMNLPEGHLSCGKCSGYRFEAWMFGSNYRVECGCMSCGESVRLLFPMDIIIPEGRFTCSRHPEKGMVILHNVDVVSVGCEKCITQINFDLRKAKGMVIAHE